MATRDEQLLIAALSTGALIVGAAAFAWWVTEAPPAPEVHVVGSRIHVHGFVWEAKHMIAAIAGLVSWLLCPALTCIASYKKFRHLWAVEGIALGMLCGPLGLLVELLLMPDLSNGRERPLSGILSGR